MRDKLTIRITPRQARLVWGIIDGAQDAGSCEDGLTEEEQEACDIVADALAKHYRKPVSDA